ncbi:MAG: hypothetical protein R2751_19115 [Bacteroidales bacterium]
MNKPNQIIHLVRPALLVLLFSLALSTVRAQPIPVELMLGNKYGAVNLAFSKSFGPESRLGFFHMNTVQFDYRDETGHSYILQDLLYVETIKHLNVTAGVAYSKGGFAPTAGLQYLLAGKNVMFLLAPRVNLVEDLSYDVFGFLQFKPALTENLKLFARAQFLSVFDGESHIKSYQWLRLGLDTKGIQFGLALNFDEYGPHPAVETSAGLFVRKEIF